MTTKIFKTRTLANNYISENYPTATTKSFVLCDESDWEDMDMPNLNWSGETPALAVLDEDFNEIDRVAWMEEGDAKYELYVGDSVAGTFDNNYDASEAFEAAVENEEQKYDDDEEVYDVKLFRDGEDVTE